jgi:hypothetical protein
MGAEAELDRIRGPWSLEEGDALLRLVGRRWRGADGMGDAECGWGRSVRERMAAGAGARQSDGWDGGGIDPAIERSRWRRGHGCA